MNERTRHQVLQDQLKNPGNAPPPSGQQFELDRRLKSYVEIPGFEPVHYLFIISSTILNVIGAVSYSSGLSVIPNITGIIISDITILYVIHSWKNLQYKGRQNEVSLLLYSMALIDIWLGLIAKGGGSFQAIYFEQILVSSIVFIFAGWVILFLSNPYLKLAREEAHMDYTEKLTERRYQNQKRLDNIQKKREKLVAEKTKRRVRQKVFALYARFLERSSVKRPQKKVLAQAASEHIYELFEDMGIRQVEGGKKQSTGFIDLRNNWAAVGDGATSLT